MNQTVTLTNDELVEALKFCGHEKRVKDLMTLFRQPVPKTERQFLFFKKKTEPTILTVEREVEQVIEAIVQSERCVQSFVNDYGRMMYYLEHNNQLLLHEIENNEHVFIFHKLDGSIVSVFEDWFPTHSRMLAASIEEIGIEISEHDYNEMHTFSMDQVEEYVESDKEVPVRQLVLDLHNYDAGFEQFTFHSFKNERNRAEMEYGTAFLPGPLCIWIAAYTNEKDGEIVIKSVDTELFFNTLSDDTTNYLKNGLPEE